MASATPKKYTVGNITAFFFISIALLFDAIKAVLFFVDAVPIVGIPLSFMLSELIGLIETPLIFGGLWFVGAYRGKSSNPALVTIATAVVDLVPIINDFPATTGAVIAIIMQSRANDLLEHKEHAAKHALEEKHKKEQAAKQRAAQQAAQRAQMNSQQALAESKRVAQSQTPIPANDNYDTDYSVAA